MGSVLSDFLDTLDSLAGHLVRLVQQLIALLSEDLVLLLGFRQQHADREAEAHRDDAHHHRAVLHLLLVTATQILELVLRLMRELADVIAYLGAELANVIAYLTDLIAYLRSELANLFTYLRSELADLASRLRTHVLGTVHSVTGRTLDVSGHLAHPATVTVRPLLDVALA